MTPNLATANEPLRAIMRSFEFTATALPLPARASAAPSVRRAAPLANLKSKIQNRK